MISPGDEFVANTLEAACPHAVSEMSDFLRILL